MRFEADRVDAANPDPHRQSSSRSASKTSVCSKFERLGFAVLGSHAQPLGLAVDRDHPAGAEHPGAADRELADRSAAPDGDRVARL